jgi:hypothetical protein
MPVARGPGAGYHGGPGRASAILREHTEVVERGSRAGVAEGKMRIGSFTQED